MVKTYVFGHKNPDSDSITSSLVMANLERELGNFFDLYGWNLLV
jgi:manganese-dependent inorganic pyrophosphatase